MDSMQSYKLWCEKAGEDPDITEELRAIEGDDAAIYERFYRELEFGTGGLRGIIGAGTNRVNIYTVRRATQGMADYVNQKPGRHSVAISYDSRIKSDVFAKAAAEVFAANGIKAYIYTELMPTPMLSYAVRKLHCTAGVMVTASHNPSKYNGYKAYGSDGCQLNLQDSEKVIALVDKVDIFTGVKSICFDQALKDGMIEYIRQDVVEDYLDQVEAQSIHKGVFRDSKLSVIYTPLNGAGNKPVRAILERVGLNQVTVVPEQEMPDGNFPTAPFPNPEIREAFSCALSLSKTVNADLLLATDPDCDRVGIAVKDGDNYTLMSGNEVGALLLNYILNERKAEGTLPEDPVMIKTIVSTELTTAIAKKFGCSVRNVLTGFKFIGEQIGLLEQKGEQDRFVFGFEESYGYLSGSFVRDKDAVVASMLICEMVAFYMGQGKTLLQVMEELYKEYGYYLHTQLNFVCEGAAGMQRMEEIMKDLRENIPAEIGGSDVLSVSDYLSSEITDMKTGEKTGITLPKSNVLVYQLPKDASVVIRPSGTEPKIKAYITAKEWNREQALSVAETLKTGITKIMGF